MLIPLAVAAAPVRLGPDDVVIPVSGVQRSQLRDHFRDARGGRDHLAIDIMAPRRTPVLAAIDGRVAKLFLSKPGGITIYQFDAKKEFVFYYAHLDGYAPGLVEGKELGRGDVIGYVGTTGNAPANAPHLHFAIGRLGNPPNWWKSEPVNPYPLLVAHGVTIRR